MSAPEDPSARGTLGTIRNGTRLLQILGNGSVFLSLSELAERSAMSPSTTHRVARSLVDAGLLAQDPRTSRYSLGPEIVRLSEGYLARTPVLRAAAPYLAELRTLTRGTVLVALLMRTSVLYADRVDGEGSGGIFREGRRMHDAFETAAGRILLAHAPDAVWEEAARTSPFGSHFSTEDRETWRKASHLTLQPDGFRSGLEIAVPVAGRSGEAIAALAVIGDPVTFTDDVLDRAVVPALLRTARATGGMVDGM